MSGGMPCWFRSALATRSRGRSGHFGKDVIDSVTPGASRLFWRLVLAQALAALIIAALAALFFGVEPALAALWGGMISLIAYSWGGFQVWLHPRNRDPRRMAGAAVRAEVGKLVIMLTLLWLTFARVEMMRTRDMAALLFLGFFLVQVAGWVVLAISGSGGDGSGSSGEQDG